jgi:PAS domain S-box-containing protein
VGSASGDGTERRRPEEALRESEERFGRLVEAAKDYAIFMTDAEGRVGTWNEGAARLFGYEEGEIVGEDAALLFTPEDREDGRPERELRLAEEEGRAEDERWHLRKDGTRFWASG